MQRTCPFLLAALLSLAGSIPLGTPDASHAASSPGHILSVTSHPDIHPEHQRLLSQTLQALPPQCRGTLRNLYVRYDHHVARGLAGKETIILRGTEAPAELRALFIHEFGHITDLGCLRGNAERGPSAFRDGSEVIVLNDPSLGFYRISWVNEHTARQGTTIADFVSGYAAKDPFEDFAESYAYFLLQPDTFALRAVGNIILQRKLLWLQQYVFQGHTSLPATGTAWDGRVPWDVTKIPYVWRGVYSPHASPYRTPPVAWK